jgi:FkbM family methyltransferase
MVKKLRSLAKYIGLFSNWPYAALARYVKFSQKSPIHLHFRDGRHLHFRPSSDHVALGEIFVMEEYKGCTNIKNPQVVWDIGGNIGCFTIWCWAHFPQAQYHSFEPTPETFEILSLNREANPKINWQLSPFGLAAADQQLVAHVPHGMYGEASQFATEGKEITFQLRDIKQVWIEKGRPQIDLYKIDCEGGEYAIFERLDAEMLAGTQCIIFEYHRVPGRQLITLTEKLEQFGFKIIPAQHSHELLCALR